MIELENSTNLLDRQRFAAELKKLILKFEDQIRGEEAEHEFRQKPSEIILRVLGKVDPEIIEADKKDEEWYQGFMARQKECLKNLKIKLSEYDIYQQKPQACEVCGEVNCVCDIVSKDPNIIVDEQPVDF